jgi:phenylacetate-CoA ligase
MSIDFKLRDFFYPASILRLRLFLEKSQWFSEEALQEYQLKRLKMILNHAYDKVPYYRTLFNELKLKPNDFKRLEDLKKIPPLTKEILKNNRQSLMAADIQKYKPVPYQTTGTTGEPVKFYLDKSSNVLEFCYYWRHWSWAGYRIRMPFAELALQHFADSDIKKLIDYSPVTNRLVMNTSRISHETIDVITKEIKKHKILFIKGSPSTLHLMAMLLEQKGRTMPLKAVFTTGEIVLPMQREKIEKIFLCRLLDSYGHMERTVAISQCPQGNYHINSEYGILEVDENNEMSSDEKVTGNVLGTSLHNLAMPLIRYEVGDIVEIKRQKHRCSCGRGLPVCERILGRKQDIIVTPDGRFITNLFILYNNLEGVGWVQMVQDKVDVLRVELYKDAGFKPESEKKFLIKLKEILGNDMKIELNHMTEEELIKKSKGKYTPVVSKINIEKYN